MRYFNIFHGDFPLIFQTFPWISHGFSMDFPWSPDVLPVAPRHGSPSPPPPPGHSPPPAPGWRERRPRGGSGSPLRWGKGSRSPGETMWNIWHIWHERHMVYIYICHMLCYICYAIYVMLYIIMELIGAIPTPLKNMSSSDWIIIPTIGENKLCSKPPTSGNMTCRVKKTCILNVFRSLWCCTMMLFIWFLRALLDHDLKVTVDDVLGHPEN